MKNNNESINLDIMIYLLENKYKDSNYVSMYFDNISMKADNLFDDLNSPMLISENNVLTEIWKN